MVVEEGGGRRPGRRPIRLTRDTIALAALDVVEERGYAAMTVRAVAARLEVAPSALYKHVTDMDQLVDVMLEHVLGQVDLELDHAWSWRRRATALAHRLRDVLRPRPGLAAVFKGRDPLGENSFALTDAFARCIVGSGLRGAAAGHAWYTLVHYVIGFEATFAASTGNLDRAFDPQKLAMVHERFAQLDPERYPGLVALGSHIWAPDLDARFDFGLELLLDGIEHAAGHAVPGAHSTV